MPCDNSRLKSDAISQSPWVGKGDTALCMIDPETNVVEPFVYRRHADIARGLGCERVDTIRRPRGNDVLYVDHDGAVNSPRWWFHVRGFPTPKPGRAIVAAIDPSWQVRPSQIPLASLRAMSLSLERIDGPSVLTFQVRSPALPDRAPIVTTLERLLITQLWQPRSDRR